MSKPVRVIRSSTKVLSSLIRFFLTLKSKIMFYVGQKVVCIDDSDINTSVYNEITPKKGIEYTVRDVCDNESIRLVEIINEPQLYIGGFMECWFRPFRFALLETYGETYSIAIQLIQELEQVDKQKIFNPEKIKA